MGCRGLAGRHDDQLRLARVHAQENPSREPGWIVRIARDAPQVAGRDVSA
ncbi:MAG: hypothetical protein JKY65_05420 [Planctomycetes bacterium]|nr:hypothetical protein [Planctomycetota bacterium]